SVSLLVLPEQKAVGEWKPRIVAMQFSRELEMCLAMVQPSFRLLPVTRQHGANRARILDVLNEPGRLQPRNGRRVTFHSRQPIFGGSACLLHFLVILLRFLPCGSFFGCARFFMDCGKRRLLPRSIDCRRFSYRVFFGGSGRGAPACKNEELEQQSSEKR